MLFDDQCEMNTGVVPEKVAVNILQAPEISTFKTERKDSSVSNAPNGTHILAKKALVQLYVSTCGM